MTEREYKRKRVVQLLLERVMDDEGRFDAEAMFMLATICEEWDISPETVADMRCEILAERAGKK